MTETHTLERMPLLLLHLLGVHLWHPLVEAPRAVSWLAQRPPRGSSSQQMAGRSWLRARFVIQTWNFPIRAETI